MCVSSLWSSKLFQCEEGMKRCCTLVRLNVYHLKLSFLKNWQILVSDSINFDELQPYDVADLLKQYFRELPECLLTNKLSDTFRSIFTSELAFRHTVIRNIPLCMERYGNCMECICN